MVENIGETFVQEFVIGLGFLSGMGIDPEGMIIQALSQALPNPSFGFKALFFLLPLIITIISILGAFAIGGWLGITAVGLAFIGGIFINHSFGAYLLVGAVLLGLIAPQSKG